MFKIGEKVKYIATKTKYGIEPLQNHPEYYVIASTPKPETKVYRKKEIKYYSYNCYPKDQKNNTLTLYDFELDFLKPRKSHLPVWW